MPIALRYGVPEHIFWDLNPKRLEPWKRMYEFQQQEKADNDDYMAWLQGRYVLEAVGSMFDKNFQYPTEPHSVLQRREEQDEANQIASDRFWAFAMAFNKRFENKEQEA